MFDGWDTSSSLYSHFSTSIDGVEGKLALCSFDVHDRVTPSCLRIKVALVPAPVRDTGVWNLENFDGSAENVALSKFPDTDESNERTHQRAASVRYLHQRCAAVHVQGQGSTASVLLKRCDRIKPKEPPAQP
jgi:hypothetical protein